MRQASKRARRSRRLMIFLFVLLAVLILWGLAALAERLFHYGADATVSAKDPVEEVQDPQPSVDPVQDSAASDPTYDPDCFTRDGEFLRYESDTMTSQIGIDVSAHQQEIDWQAVAASGVEFAILRVGYRGYTEGSIQEDAYFQQNLDGAIDAGLEVGVYFFSQAITKDEAVEEAKFVLNWIEGYELDYPIFFDWEDIEADARTDGMDMLTLTGCVDAFCAAIEDAGYRAGVYFNQRFGYEEFDLRELQDYELWLAEYNLTPSFAYHFEVWQYANDGMLSGVDGAVDLNLAFVPKTGA